MHPITAPDRPRSQSMLLTRRSSFRSKRSPIEGQSLRMQLCDILG